MPLTKAMVKFLESPDKKGYNISAYYGRIEEYGLRELWDLALIAESVPEERLAEIFTPASTLPLVYHLLGHHLKKREMRHYQLARLLAEWSLSVFQDKVQEISGVLWFDTWNKFIGIMERIRMIIPRAGYTEKTVDGKLIVEESDKK